MDGKLTSEQVTKIYHLLRSVEIIENFAKQTKNDDATNLLLKMATPLANQIAMELGMEWRVQHESDGRS